jgi:hypothetical protein
MRWNNRLFFFAVALPVCPCFAAGAFAVALLSLCCFLFSPFSLFFSFSPAYPKGASDFFPPFTFSLFPFVLSLIFFLFPVPSIPCSRLEKGRSVATATAAAMGAPDSNSDLHKPIIPKTPKPSGNWRASQIKELFQ